MSSRMSNKKALLLHRVHSWNARACASCDARSPSPPRCCGRIGGGGKGEGGSLGVRGVGRKAGVSALPRCPRSCVPCFFIYLVSALGRVLGVLIEGGRVHVVHRRAVGAREESAVGRLGGRRRVLVGAAHAQQRSEEAERPDGRGGRAGRAVGAWHAVRRRVDRRAARLDLGGRRVELGLGEAALREVRELALARREVAAADARVGQELRGGGDARARRQKQREARGRARETNARVSRASTSQSEEACD